MNNFCISHRAITALLFLLPALLQAQFNLAGITAAFERQRTLSAQADSLYRQGEYGRACALYDEAYSRSKNNDGRYAIRKVRCWSHTEPATAEMVEYLASRRVNISWVAKDSVIGPYLAREIAHYTPRPSLADRYMPILDSLAIVDQEIREPDVPLEEALHKDSMNYNLLLQGFREAGTYINSLGGSLVLIHQLSNHPKDMPYMIGLLNEALLEGNIDTETYAVIIDEAFYHLCGCVPFGVFGSHDAPLPTCAGEEVARLYRTRLQGK